MSLTTKLTLHSAVCMSNNGSMVMPSVTCHSPFVAANNTTEQLTCIFTDHILSVACGGGGGVVVEEGGK